MTLQDMEAVADAILGVGKGRESHTFVDLLARAPSDPRSHTLDPIHYTLEGRSYRARKPMFVAHGTTNRNPQEAGQGHTLVTGHKPRS